MADAVAVNTTSLAQDPAPIDKSDEPRFASTVSAVKQMQAEAKLSEAGAKAEKAEASASAEAVAGQKEESKILESEIQESKGQESTAERSKAEDVKTKELKAEKIAQPVPAAANAPEPDEPAPSDEELAEALRLLTPATGHADISIVPSHGTLVAAGQLLAEEVARNAAAGPHWVAESVALSPEEAAISLEAEMFRTFATTPATTATLAPVPQRESGRITGVSAIAAAVENRLVEAEIAATARALAEPRAERHAEATLTEASVVAVPTEGVRAISNAVSPVVEENATEIATNTKIATDEFATKKQEAEQNSYPGESRGDSTDRRGCDSNLCGRGGQPQRVRRRRNYRGTERRSR